MTKVWYLALISSFFSAWVFAQTPDWSWGELLSGSDDLYSTDMAVDQYGSVYVSGAFYSPTQVFEKTTLTAGNSGAENPFLIRYNSLGEIKAAVKPEQIISGGGGSSSINSIAVDDNSNVYTTGYYRSSYLVFGNDTLVNTKYSDGFVAKYDAGGNPIWALNLGGADHEYGNVVAVDKIGNFYCAGKFKGSATLTIEYLNNGIKTSTTLSNSLSTTSDIFLLKYTQDGELLWAKSFGGKLSKDNVSGLAIDNNNNIIIGGEWYDASITLGSFTFSNSGNYDSYICLLDENGNVQWAKAIASAGYDSFYDIAANQGIYVTASVTSDIAIGNDTLLFQGGGDLLLVKYDQSGNVKWANLYGGSGNEIPSSLAIKDGEDIVLAGDFTEDFQIGTTTLTNVYQRDILLAKFDSSGNSLWAIGYGSTDQEFSTALAFDNENNLYFSGYHAGDTLILGPDTLINYSTAGKMFVAAVVDYNDTVSIIDTTRIYQFDNGGIYGGSCSDLTYSPITSRLFAGIETPASLFFSDDNGSSWSQSFSNDSLEYIQNGVKRGWSGKAEKILCNTKAWVAVETNNTSDSKYSSVVISYENGDTNTWETVVDQYLLNSWGYTDYAASAIALSDYYLFAAMGPYIIRKDTNPVNTSNIIQIQSYINGLFSNSIVSSIAVANNSNGYPYYIAIDVNGNPGGAQRQLYKFDGTNFSQLQLPSTLNGIRYVFTHPNQITGDTIFITGHDDASKQYKIYSSYDGGVSWVDISPNLSEDFLQDVDYSPSWNLTSSNNCILIIPGNAISKDLGNSWENISDTLFNANAVHPGNIDIMAGSAQAVEISTSGAGGTFSRTPNYGLEALHINKIARTQSESLFYIATQTGIGYTSAYLDTAVSPYEKWTSPHGAFPLISDTINFGAVAINPFDTLRVIAGCPYGFYVSKTGPNGFNRIVPTDFSSNDPQIKDIAFINQNVAIAISGGDSTYDSGKGNIWRTADGGLSWTKVSPFDFCCGNAIAIGMLGSDTVIYIGSGLLNTDVGYLWKSTDIGLSWEKVKNGPTSLAGTTVLGLPILDVAVDPRGKDTIYIAAGYGDDFAFVVSFDGGENYLYLNAYAEHPYTSVAINQQYPDTVYAASGREIYLYDLANNNFRFVYRGLPDEQIPDLMTGSILVGTTTGFYTFDPKLESDSVLTIQENKPANENFIANIYPNPFASKATLRLSLNTDAEVQIEMHDVMGKKLSTIYDGNCAKGSTNFIITAEGLSSGIYMVYIHVNNESNRKLLYHIK